jgi:hypothetical protein
MPSMKKDTAERVLLLAREASTKINESLKVVQESESPAVFEQYRTAAGTVMGELYFSVIEPILTKYPALTHPGMKGDEPKKASRRRSGPKKRKP